MKLRHKGHLNTRNRFPKVGFFPNPTISLLILDELKKSRFWGNEEKFMKSKGLKLWIHSKVIGR
jgi:hypothetical protein